VWTHDIGDVGFGRGLELGKYDERRLAAGASLEGLHGPGFLRAVVVGRGHAQVLGHPIRAEAREGAIRSSGECR